MKAFARAKKFARENPVTARDMGISDALEIAGELYRALKKCETFIRHFESDWSTLTDDEHGKYPGLKPLAAAQAAIDHAETFRQKDKSNG